MDYIYKYNKYTKKITQLSGGNIDNNQNKYVCLTQKQKEIFFDKINEYYKYDNSIVDNMKNTKYVICETKILENITLFDKNTINDISKLLSKTADFLDKYGIEYWLDCGTLLGAMRNNKFIPWDDDGDLGMTPKYYYKLRDIMNRLPKEENEKNEKTPFFCSSEFKIKFREDILPRNLILNKNKDFYLVKVYNHNDNTITNNDVFIDIVIYYRSGDKYISNHKNWLDRFYFYADNMFPLEKIEFEGKQYKIIKKKESENYLNRAYYFWKHVGVADHAHFKDLKQTRNKNLYFILSKEYIKNNDAQDIFDEISKIKS